MMSISYPPKVILISLSRRLEMMFFLTLYGDRPLDINDTTWMIWIPTSWIYVYSAKLNTLYITNYFSCVDTLAPPYNHQKNDAAYFLSS